MLPKLLLTKLLGSLALLMNFAQQVASATKNKWITTILILMTFAGGVAMYHWGGGTYGLTLFLSVILVVTVVMAGLNKVSDPVLQKIQTKMETLHLNQPVVVSAKATPTLPLRDRDFPK